MSNEVYKAKINAVNYPFYSTGLTNEAGTSELTFAAVNEAISNMIISVNYDSAAKRITFTRSGATPSEVVTVATIKTDMSLNANDIEEVTSDPELTTNRKWLTKGDKDNWNGKLGTDADTIGGTVGAKFALTFNFIGESSTAITSGGIEVPTISGYVGVAKTDRNCVLYNGKTFYWFNSEWNEFGDLVNYYTKDDIDDGFAPLASPAFTGTPTAPTPDSTSGDTVIATVKYVKDTVQAAIDDAIAASY